jgi:adenylate cyclase class IV
MEHQPSRNIELKARYPVLSEAHRIAAALPAQRIADQQQRDTYFHCAHGRLKLREITGQRAELIWYARADEQGPKASQYYVVPVIDPRGLQSALESAWGLRGVVQKHRAIYLYRHVRIHLDEVIGLGSFLEFEAVLDPGLNELASHELLHELQMAFRIAAADLVPVSYGDLI